MSTDKAAFDRIRKQLGAPDGPPRFPPSELEKTKAELWLANKWKELESDRANRAEQYSERVKTIALRAIEIARREKLRADKAEAHIATTDDLKRVVDELHTIVPLVKAKANATDEEKLKAAAQLYQKIQDPEKAAILSAYLESHNVHKAAKTASMSVGKAHRLLHEIEDERGIKIIRRNWAQGEHAGNTYRHGKTGPLAKRDRTHRAL